MMRVARVRFSVAFVAACLIAAGCGADDDATSADPTPGPTAATAGDVETDEDEAVAAPTQTTSAPTGPSLDLALAPPANEMVVNADGEEVEDTVVPIDLYAVVEQGVEDGLWSEAEGLTIAIDSVVERNGRSASGVIDGVSEPGLTSLLRRAADLLEAGKLSDTEAADLQAALAFLNPTQDVLDAISTRSTIEPTLTSPLPELDEEGSPLDDDEESLGEDTDEDVDEDQEVAFGEFPVTGVSFVRTVTSAQDATVPQCGNVAEMGFSNNLGTGTSCYIFQELTVQRNRLRVYYPFDWEPDASRMTLVATTFDALALSNHVYATLGRVGDINAVFSLTSSGTTLASQMYFNLAGACPLTIFPSADDDGSAVYRQTIAHEVFHCVQDRTFSATAPYGTHEWWLEGSAEYFSNVVYPTVNDEHNRTSLFDAGSIDTDLTAMSYENTVFFQYYANRRGNAGTMTLLHAVSDGGAGLGTLTGVDGMEELWQEFVVAFVADAVLDSGGGTVGGASHMSGIETVRGPRRVDFDTKPMVATRYIVDYTQERRFVQAPSGSPAHAAVKAAERTDVTAWTSLPEEIRSKCQDDERIVVVTTSFESNAKFTADVTEVEIGECDPCLLGPWDMQLASFTEYMGAVFESLGFSVALEMSGNYYFDFDDEGGLTAERRNLAIQIPGAPTNVISGIDAGRYTTDGETLTVSGLAGSGDVSFGAGSSVGFLTDPSGGVAPYECGRDVLTISDPSYADLVFDRIDEIPEPGAEEVETGDPDN